MTARMIIMLCGEAGTHDRIPVSPMSEQKRRDFYGNSKRDQSLYRPRGHDHGRGREAAGRGIRLER